MQKKEYTLVIAGVGVFFLFFFLPKLCVIAVYGCQRATDYIGINGVEK